MKHEYPIKTAARTGLLTVTEHADRIAICLTFDRFGDLGDALDIARQLLPVLARFDSDPRPLAFDAPGMGMRAAIDLDGDGKPFAVLAEETRQ